MYEGIIPITEILNKAVKELEIKEGEFEKTSTMKIKRYEELSKDKNDVKKVTKKEIKAAVMYGLKAGKDMAEADLAAVAYMQGAERYKPKWYKVADGDLPPIENDYCSINVLTDKGDIAYYVYNYNCWCVEPSGTVIEPPIAWYELSIFKEM